MSSVPLGMPELPEGFWWRVEGCVVTICEWHHAPPSIKVVHRVARVTAVNRSPFAIRDAAEHLHRTLWPRLEREAQARKDYQ